MQLSIPAPKTPDGRVYRFSPNEVAHPRHFVLGEAVRPEDSDKTKQAVMKLERTIIDRLMFLMHPLGLGESRHFRASGVVEVSIRSAR
ncbi:MAG: hypothetical protein M3Q08_00040 [Pseudomonadota bacterium]|nr:hypothetical protein [Pseudomonadota bacterium]